MAIRQGRYTLNLTTRPSILGNAAVVGKTEGEGPLSAEFDHIYTDDTLGEISFEKAESTYSAKRLSVRSTRRAKRLRTQTIFLRAIY